MSVYRPKDASGRYKSDLWHYDFVIATPTGERCRFHGSTGQKTRTAAERVERQRREAAATGQLEHSLTLDEAAFRFFEEVASAQVSRDDTAKSLEHLCRLVGGSTLLVGLSSSKIADAARRRAAEFVTIKTKTGPVKHGLVSAATVNRQIVEMARRLLRRARLVWKLPVDVEVAWDKILLPEAQRSRILTDAERAAYVAAIREDYRPIMSAYLLTGVRKAAFCGLKKDAVDFDSDGFTIILKRKRGETARKHFLPFTLELRAVFAEEMKKSPLPYVFTYVVQHGPRAGMRAPIVYNSIRRVHENARSTAGLDDFRFHDTRHDTATRALRATSNLRLVQRMLGHSDIASTARYAQVVDDDLRSGMQSFSLSRNSPGGGESEAEAILPKCLKDEG